MNPSASTPPTPSSGLTGPPHRARRPFLRWLGWASAPLGVLLLWVLYLLATDNFHPVVAGQAYRSGQMRPSELARCIRKHNIKTVINLRGPNPGKPWYEAELRVAQETGIAHRSLALSSRKWVSTNQVAELVALMKEAPKPLLMHCDGGADRSAFAAAVYEAAIAQIPPEQAEKEFSPWFGYWPLVWKEKARLKESFRTHFGHGP